MSSSFSRSRESALGLRARIECIRALRTISSVEKELNLLFSPLFLLEGVSSRYARKKNRARARARPERIERRRRERVSQIFLARAHRSSRPRDTRARVVFARASTHISKANVGGAGEMSHCSRKNPNAMCRAHLSLPVVVLVFRSLKIVSRGLQNRKWSREFSVSSENETSRTMQLEYKTTRRAMYGSSCPSNLCRRLGGVCFFFFSLVFFFVAF